MEKNYWQVVPEEMIQLRGLRGTLSKKQNESKPKKENSMMDEDHLDHSFVMMDDSPFIQDSDSQAINFDSSIVFSESIISQDDDDFEVKMGLDLERFHAAFGCMLAEVQGERDDEKESSDDIKSSTIMDEFLNGLFE